jgi:RNA polymerase sigma-70 factor (ECF subfamily)
MTLVHRAVLAVTPQQSRHQPKVASSIVIQATGACGGDGVGEVVDPSPAADERTLDFDEFYAAHFRSVTIQLYAYFGDMGDAQDVTQEAFTRAWQRWSTVCHYGNPVAWVRTVAWRLAISRWRRVRTAMRHLATQREEHEPALDGLRVDLVRALRTLPDTQRRAVVQHYLGGMSVAEIAKDCSTAEGTVKSWLSRARGALAQQLTDSDAGEGVASDA